MDEIDALGRQMLLERPKLVRGRLSVYRKSKNPDLWFPRMSVSIKKAGTDDALWQWASHSNPIDYEGPPPYGEEEFAEKYFELAKPTPTTRGLEIVFLLEPGATTHGKVESFSAAIYLYPHSLEERGIQVGVIDFPEGLTTSSVPLYFRVNFPW